MQHIEFDEHTWTAWRKWQQWPRGETLNIFTPEELIQALRISKEAESLGIVERVIYRDGQEWGHVTPEQSIPTIEETIIALVGSLDAWKERQQERLRYRLGLFCVALSDYAEGILGTSTVRTSEPSHPVPLQATQQALF